MNLDRAFRRRAALAERLARIEQSGHPGFLAASSGHRTCALHGDYAATALDCPVCEGRSTGRSWSIESGAKRSRMLTETPANEDDGSPLFSDRYAPEIARAWRGDL